MSAMLNLIRVGHSVGQNLGCSLWSRSMMLGSAVSEHGTTQTTNREIIFQDFQPGITISLPQRHGHTDRQTQ